MSYDITEVPERTSDPGSRFFLPISPTGITGPNAEIMVGIFTNATAKQIADFREEAPPSHTIKTYTVLVKSGPGKYERTYKLAYNGDYSGPRLKRPSERIRPTQHVAKSELPPAGTILDRLCLQDYENLRATDSAIYRALLEVCQYHQLIGNPLRKLCQQVTNLIILRAGVLPPRFTSDLPALAYEKKPLDALLGNVEEDVEAEVPLAV